MDYKLQITDRAVELLGRIIDYLVSRLKNPTAARKLLTEIEAIYSHLESEPYIYPPCDDPFLKSKGYRKATINHYQYVILFQVEETSRTVFVSGVELMGYDKSGNILRRID